ncbi:MAG TPA: peptide deformylase [Thermoleophilaceae bacterium]
MAVRTILRYPHGALKTVARELGAGDAAEAERVTTDLLDTMSSFGHCVGLAAPQLGELVRIAVVDVTGHKKATTCNGRLVLVNPRVVSAEGAAVAREGCLSIPDLTANVRRSTRIEVVAEGGLAFVSEGFEARCVLHELDHLDGLLFLDRVDSLARDVFRRKRYR